MNALRAFDGETLKRAEGLDSCPPARIAIVTDAWAPQCNGVVRTLEQTTAMLRRWGHDVMIIAPADYHSVPCPTYSEIQLAIPRPGAVARRLAGFRPDAVHIATEGPLGLAARRHCIKAGRPFTTAYHTQFPQYLAQRTGLDERVFWPFMRWFHAPAVKTMVATERLAKQLTEKRFTDLHRWSRGVNLEEFGPHEPMPQVFESLERPVLLYVGRVAIEKNLPAFLTLSYPATKVVVGDGPARPELEARFPEAVFVGRKEGRELTSFYAHADVLVFPSLTDTFGLVMIEAMACGTPVAAFPVAGPADVVSAQSGALSHDLARAVDAARYCRPADCIARARMFSWSNATREFFLGLALSDAATVPNRLPSASG